MLAQLGRLLITAQTGLSIIVINCIERYATTGTGTIVLSGILIPSIVMDMTQCRISLLTDIGSGMTNFTFRNLKTIAGTGGFLMCPIIDKGMILRFFSLFLCNKNLFTHRATASLSQTGSRTGGGNSRNDLRSMCGRNGLLCDKSLTADRALHAVGQTILGTAGSLTGNLFLSMSG